MIYNYANPNNSADILIAGAGLVGASLAQMLASHNRKVIIVEKNCLSAPPRPDARSLVLSYSSVQVLRALGIWSALAAQASLIENIQVSQLGHFGSARFEAARLGLAHFGAIIPADLLLQTVQQTLINSPTIAVLDTASIEKIHLENGAQLHCKQGEKTFQLSAPLLVAADGSDSLLRKSQNIAVKTHDYQQIALITQVQIDKPHQQTAYERLTANGPIALLPRQGNYFGLVWTVATAEKEILLSYSDAEFLARLQKIFGYKIGKFLTVAARQTYPLQSIQAMQTVLPHFILLGNAAHTLHPIAGQGFNLGLRDAAALAELLVEQSEITFADLQNFEKQRHTDQQQIYRFTDRTIRLLSHTLLAPLVSAGLISLDLLPFLQGRLVRKLLGYSGKIPKLLCGE
jgi:2-octaprenyl-6-methoxyphenol hydroxylase